MQILRRIGLIKAGIKHDFKYAILTIFKLIHKIEIQKVCLKLQNELLFD